MFILLTYLNEQHLQGSGHIYFALKNNTKNQQIKRIIVLCPARLENQLGQYFQFFVCNQIKWKQLKDLHPETVHNYIKTKGSQYRLILSQPDIYFPTSLQKINSLNQIIALTPYSIQTDVNNVNDNAQRKLLSANGDCISSFMFKGSDVKFSDHELFSPQFIAQFIKQNNCFNPCLDLISVKSTNKLMSPKNQTNVAGEPHVQMVSSETAVTPCKIKKVKQIQTKMTAPERFELKESEKEPEVILPKDDTVESEMTDSSILSYQMKKRSPIIKNKFGNIFYTSQRIR